MAQASGKSRILVIEDDDQTALFIQHVLEGAGYQVSCATDGRQAAEMIGKAAVPDLVTLDVDLPHESGDKVMMKIKTTDGWDRVPVVMITRQRKLDSTWAVKAGAKAHLLKPFKPDELVQTVARLVKKS